MTNKAIVLLDNPEGREMVKKACREKALEFVEFEDLVQAYIEQTGKQRMAGLWDSFDDILDRIILGE